MLLDLVYHEYVLREEFGENPQSDDYLRQFPDLAGELELHFEVHRAVIDRSLLETDEPAADRTWPAADNVRREPLADLPNYEILESIGEGGMATVYRARHRRLGRIVALKMFHPGRIPAARELKRFEAEASFLARLSHPNIIQIFEIGQSNGLPFLALEFAAAGSLSDRLGELAMPAVDAARLVKTLAVAVGYAHQQQIVHRDLKPANILFTSGDIPKIADFGLAKLFDDELPVPTDITRSGESVGTPRYMAPEQAAGKKSLVGPQTDVFFAWRTAL